MDRREDLDFEELAELRAMLAETLIAVDATLLVGQHDGALGEQLEASLSALSTRIDSVIQSTREPPR